METKLEMPQPARAAWSSTAMPTAPDWEATASRPAAGSTVAGRVGAKVAASRTFGSVLSTPRQFGPTSRMPCARASRTSSARAARPAASVPSNPELSTTAARTPAAPASASTSGTALAGTAITARST